MNKNKKQKGYALAIVIILTFIMTVIITATSILIMRYMIFAKKDLGNFIDQKNSEAAIMVVNEEVAFNA